MDIRVLYEDNHLLVVEKPANVPVQADASGDEDLLTACKGYIKEKYQKPGEVYLGLVHRLDRPVGGVMVFARTSKAAARLTEQFSAHRARKRYAAIVEGEAPAEGRLTDFLLKNESTNTTAVVAVGTPGAKQAKLSFRTLARDKGLSLLDVDLQTGRPHQIRVQLSHAGYPIHGDQRYNPNATVGEQIRLWAYALTIAHPTLKEEMTFYALPPFGEFPSAVKYLPAFRAASAVYEPPSARPSIRSTGWTPTRWGWWPSRKPRPPRRRSWTPSPATTRGRSTRLSWWARRKSGRGRWSTTG